MHPASFICTGIFLVFMVGAIVMALDRKRPDRERISTGILASSVLLIFVFAPGCPVRGAVDARRVKELCGLYSVGGPINPVEFQRRAKALGLTAFGGEDKGYVHAHAAVILRVLRICDIEFADGRITKIRSETYAR